MAKRQKTKDKNETQWSTKTLHRNIMIEQCEHPKKYILGRTQVLWKVSISCSTSGIRCVTTKWHEYHLIWKSCSTPLCK
jgi:hypothetical protein